MAKVYLAVNPALTFAHAHIAADFGNNRFGNNLVAGNNLLAEAHVVNFAEYGNFAAVFFRVQQGNAANLPAP